MRNLTKEHKEKLSKAHKGKKLSEEHKKNIGKSLKGHKTKEETKKKIGEKNKESIKKLWENKEYRDKMERIKKEKGTYDKISKKLKGRKLSEEHRKKAIKNLEPRYGKDNPAWKGGITPLNQKIRKSKEYRLWRIAVLERDNYTCRFCGQVGGIIHADHIKPFSLFPELRFAIDNGRTLCVDCHKKTDTYGRRKNG